MSVLDLAGHELIFPRTLSEFRRVEPDFRKWLEGRDATWLDSNNEWEVLRYRYPNRAHGVGVLYQKKTGALTYTGPVGFDMKEFVKGGELTHKDKCSPPPIKPARKQASPEKQESRRVSKLRKDINNPRTVVGRLWQRDGNKCWYCAKHLGIDITKEHLVAKKNGGTDADDNLVLAHARCNQMAGHLPYEAKLLLREYLQGRSDKNVTPGTLGSTRES